MPQSNGAERDVIDARDSGLGGPSFSLWNRIRRAIFMLSWFIAAAWTPPTLHGWRCTILRAFGARVGRGVRFYGSTIVWNPANLTIGDYSIIGPRVRLYNQGRISIGSNAVVSQGAHLCASSHDTSDEYFQLILRPIFIDGKAWVAADAFVGPGVSIGEGAILGARAAAFNNLAPWSIYGGNPAKFIKKRLLASRTR